MMLDSAARREQRRREFELFKALSCVYQVAARLPPSL